MGTLVMQTIKSQEQLLTMVLSGEIENPGHLCTAAMQALLTHNFEVVYRQWEFSSPFHDERETSRNINFNLVFEFDAQKIQANFVIEHRHTGMIFGITSGSYWSKYGPKDYIPIPVSMALAEFDDTDEYEYIHTTIMGTMNHSLRALKTAYLKQKTARKAY